MRVGEQGGEGFPQRSRTQTRGDPINKAAPVRSAFTGQGDKSTKKRRQRMRKFSAKAFAQLFVRLRSGSETAVKLGVAPKDASAQSARLLADERVKKEIARLDESDTQTLAYVKSGLSRLAFGQVNDAAALVFAEQPDPEQIAGADLFNVSELKRVKGGGVEVKFFDRQKALEKLYELDGELHGRGRAEDFMKALCTSAQGDISHLLDEEGEQ